MKLEIIISIDEHGNVTVNGPLENKVVCYGLLEVARQAVERHDVKARQVTPVTASEFEAAKQKLGKGV